ncbi:PREDICTED: coiled-coil domain-containing protein 181-like [Galeopterus variegatus]|uniref:Coiled-coil domain-containing protein 181 n=1 Tax=Galeopterus variegatus TaxID=482537 RepID=A0ABM0SCY5_GALVR|nr:PREDICTED: coiled-coil domain-containing protein 181-like [Galeopterus variegatus]
MFRSVTKGNSCDGAADRFLEDDGLSVLTAFSLIVAQADTMYLDLPVQQFTTFGWSSFRENRDPQQAFRSWLKKKHEEQMKERKAEELRKQEECLFFLIGTEGRERAFKQWLRRKRIEKIEEQQAVKERARQLRLEAKRSKQLQNHLCMSEAKSFRFTDHYN